MAIVFPSNPNIGDVFEDWQWDGTRWVGWRVVPPIEGPPGQTLPIISPTPPENPVVPALWHQPSQRLWAWDDTEWWAAAPIQAPPVARGGWTSQTSAANNNWQSVAYGNNLFVAVANSGLGNRVMTSPDGITWTLLSLTPDDAWGGIAYANNLFVATAGSAIISSPDGITWTRVTVPPRSWTGIAYGNNTWVTTAASGTTTEQVLTSSDAITWVVQQASAASVWRGLTYGNGLFVAVGSAPAGQVMTSPDGITWTARTSAAINTWTSVVYANGLFVAVASSGTGNRVMTSPDGIDWTSRATPADNNWSSVTYGNGLFVAVANLGTNRVMTSPDGINWTLRTSAIDINWTSVIYGRGTFVAVAASGTGNRVMTMRRPEWELLDFMWWAAGAAAPSGPFDTTGADLVIVAASDWMDQAPNLTDNKGNTWTLIRRHRPSGGTNSGATVWYLRPTSPSQVGENHIFTISMGNSVNGSVMTFRGSAESPVDQHASRNGTDRLATSPPITPTERNSLVLTIGSAAAMVSSVTPSDFNIIFRSMTGMSIGAAYLVQKEPEEIAATWTATPSWGITSMILSFKLMPPDRGEVQW